MTKRIHGYLKSGEPITDELIEVFGRDAENGFSEEMIITARGATRSPLKAFVSDLIEVRSGEARPSRRHECFRGDSSSARALSAKRVAFWPRLNAVCDQRRSTQEVERPAGVSMQD